MNPWLVFVYVLIGMLSANAQSYPEREVDPERLVDEIFPQQNLDVNYPELYESLLLRFSGPLDLNKATAEELRSLFILSESQVMELVQWRTQNGDLLSVYELQALPGFDLATIYKLVPFVRVRDASSVLDHRFLKRATSEGDSYLVVRSGKTLEEQKGYRRETDSAARYTGSPYSFYTRFRLSRPGDFSFGFTSEKDPGEKLRLSKSNHWYGADFFSWHAQAIGKGKIRNLIIGDYSAQFGQGLILGGGFGMGKGSETITTLRRSNLGFLPYSSVGESGFFRGAAASFQLTRNLTLHAMLSALRRDAVAQNDTTDAEYSFVSSFALSGLHRTSGELASRRKIMELNKALVLSYKLNNFEAGIVVHHTNFSLPLARKPTVYNQFAFNGDHLLNIGGFLNYTFHNLSFFSEAASSHGHGTAWMAGLIASVTRKLDLAVLLRSYAKNYYSFYSNAIAENTTPQNESGIYWGWKYSWSKKYSASGYADLFYFPWLRYRAYDPGSGSEWLLRFNYQPAKTTALFFQVREERKPRNTESLNVYQTADAIKQSVWINADYAIDPKLKFKTRAQFSRYTINGDATRGTVLLHDVSVDLGAIDLSARFALFHTDDYDNRQYVYERDVWLAFSFPAYYGTGMHHYLLLHGRLSKSLDLWLRWSHTRYTDRQTIGSGGETINGNTRNDLKLQARIRFF